MSMMPAPSLIINKHRFKLSMACLLTLGISSCHQPGHNAENGNHTAGNIEFISSDSNLNQAWEWAKSTALSYVRDSAPVGPWYEAALPGRDAFCMRDVAHQSLGASALGLDRHTENMLRRFAESISESKDWCSFWEINSEGYPAPVDYRNDKDFWYNLPANFDLLDACFRMYVRTGNRDYITDSIFINFYEKTMTAYVDRWQLDPADILKRRRMMNLPEGAGRENHKFMENRGIPGYYEGAGGLMKLGIDLLGAQYAAYNWYHFYLREIAGKPSGFERKAKEIDSLINQVFLDEIDGRYGSILYENGMINNKEVSPDFSYYLLHYKVVEDTGRINMILDQCSENMTSVSVEMASHFPEIFFQHGRPADGLFMIKHLADSSKHRREYPENPFSLIGAFVHGLMGADIHVPERYVSTLSGLTNPGAWAKAVHIPFGNGSFDLQHYGRHTTELKNNTGDTLYWQAFLEARPDTLYIDGQAYILPETSFSWYGVGLNSWLTAVPPGESRNISRGMPEIKE